jgi:chromosome segregation ATPase
VARDQAIAEGQW